MLYSYKLFPIHALILTVVLFSILFFKKKFPNKKLSKPFILLLFSVLPVISVFRVGVYESGDFSLHIYRAIDFFRSLSEGILMPSWASSLNNGFGYPLFIFLNPLPYYLISLFHSLGFSFITSMKLFLALAYILSGFSMYLFAKKLLRNELSAFTASIFYQFAPYHLIDLHLRVAVGEIISFTTFPLLMYFAVRLKDKFSFTNITLLSLSMLLTVISHQAIAAFSLIFFFVFALFLVSESKNKIATFQGYFISTILGASLFFVYIFPYLYFTKFTLKGADYSMVFTSVKELILSPYYFGFLYQGANGELSTPIGLSQLLSLPAGFVLLLFRKENKKILVIFLAFCIVTIFLITGYSKIVWEIVPIIKITIISYRLLLFLALFTAVLAGILAKYLNEKIVWAFILITIFSTLLNWGNRALNKNITDLQLYENVGLSSSKEEGWSAGIPKWREENGFEKDKAYPPIISFDRKVIIKEQKRTTTEHVYYIESMNNSFFQENTWYFPGWQVFLNDKKTQIYTKNPQHPGTILFFIPRGKHEVMVEYQDVSIFSFIKKVSQTSIIFCLVFIISAFLLKKRNNAADFKNV